MKGYFLCAGVNHLMFADLHIILFIRIAPELLKTSCMRQKTNKFPYCPSVTIIQLLHMNDLNMPAGKTMSHLCQA